MAANFQKFDIVIIGTGPSGEGATMMAAKSHKKVAAVERYEEVGGGCTHWATIPAASQRGICVRAPSLSSASRCSSRCASTTPRHAPASAAQSVARVRDCGRHTELFRRGETAAPDPRRGQPADQGDRGSSWHRAVCSPQPRHRIDRGRRGVCAGRASGADTHRNRRRAARRADEAGTARGLLPRHFHDALADPATLCVQRRPSRRRSPTRSPGRCSSRSR